MSSFEPRPALPEHNSDICEIFDSTPMEGQISIRFERRPDYFAGARIQNLNQKVYVGWDSAKEKAFAITNVGSRPVYIGGEIQDVSYYCDLRILPEYQSRTQLARGFKYLREEILKGDNYAQCLIVSDNLKALDVLTSKRAGLPSFYHTGDYHTWAIGAGQKFRCHSTLTIRKATVDDIQDMQSFMDQEGSRKLFFPVYDLSKVGTHPYYQNQRIEDYYLVFDGSSIIGMVGTWDVEFCKQSRIVSYAPSIRWSRRIFNSLAFLNKGFHLPPEGSLLKYFLLHSIVIKNDDPDVLRALLERIGKDCTGYDYFLLGLAAQDPLNAAVGGFKKRLYKAGHYLISFGKPGVLDRLPSNYYLEAARL